MVFFPEDGFAGLSSGDDDVVVDVSQGSVDHPVNIGIRKKLPIVLVDLGAGTPLCHLFGSFRPAAGYRSEPHLAKLPGNVAAVDPAHSPETDNAEVHHSPPNGSGCIVMV